MQDSTYQVHCTDYITNLIRTVEARLNKKIIPRKTPMMQDDHPELDTTAFCNEVQHNEYRSVLGNYGWIVQLCRIDIIYAVAILSSYLAKPRVGHLERAMYLLGYLKNNTNLGMAISAQAMSEKHPPRQHDTCQLVQVRRSIDRHLPDPTSTHTNQLHVYCDASFGNNKLTGQGYFCFIVKFRGTVLDWKCGRIKRIVTSTYEAELVALKHALEALWYQKYLLQSMGIGVGGTCLVSTDSMSVVNCMTLNRTQTRNRHTLITYNLIRQALAHGEIILRHVTTDLQEADLGTKALGYSLHKNLKMKNMVVIMDKN